MERSNSGSVIVISDDDYVGEVKEKADGEISSEIHMVSSFSSYISTVQGILWDVLPA